MIYLFQSRLQAFQKLGTEILALLSNGGIDTIIKQQSIENKWFTEENCRLALAAIAKMLDKKSCEAFFQRYRNLFQKERKTQRIAVISAGNIPCAAFHDFFCILVGGNRFIGKLSSKDALLLPFLSKILIKVAPEFAEKIFFVEKLPKFDKIIATGNNNSARYFEYYFKDYPMLLRKNRNSVAILTGKENVEDLQKLSIDVFRYFGLGCRSVSKIYVPKNYHFSKLIEIFQKTSSRLLCHNAYVNNYEYQRAIYMLNNVPYYDGNSFLLVENQPLSSPVAVIYYESYDSLSNLLLKINHHKDRIQCIVTKNKSVNNPVNFGKTQFPSLFDYPDSEDIMFFV
ncbi:MAG: hypothetical protein LBI45_09660 [Bacteroidales bacterium]|nr:hypothetical protein [Bacteroidales bacterium]